MARNRFSDGPSRSVKKAGFKASAALLLAVIAAPIPAAPVPPIPAASVVHANPALWEIRDADTTIYLFGTFHTLDARTAWFDDRVRQAFDRSGELVLETVIPADISGAGAQVSETGTDGKRRLKPFIAQTQNAVDHGRTMGMSVENGADA